MDLSQYYYAHQYWQIPLYSNDPIMSDFKNYGFSGVVAKPYRVEEMKKVLKEVLDS